MRYGAKVLFDEVSTSFMSGRRYGLTGPNGAGKSTFMKVLTGEMDPQKGTVVRPKKLGVLRQDQFAFDDYRVIDTVIMGNKRALGSDGRTRQDLRKAGDDRRRWHEAGRTGRHRRRRRRLHRGERRRNPASGLDIPDELHERQMGEVCGRPKSPRPASAGIVRHPQALLLDEPTNHLDLDSIHWLQKFLNRYNGILIVISHDRHFLNNVCTHIADIDYETIILYTGAYDEMVVAKTQIRSQIESQNNSGKRKSRS